VGLYAQATTNDNSANKVQLSTQCQGLEYEHNKIMMTRRKNQIVCLLCKNCQFHSGFFS